MNQRTEYLLLIVLLVTLAVFSTAEMVFAENIDPNNDGSQYVWGENVGWLNAEPLGDGGPGVEVTDSQLTGYIWAENIGWVSLSCENTSSCGTVNYGVTNDGSGNLSGYGWAENAGWISFACDNTASCATVDYGVTLAAGEFTGYAWGENIGWISFKSTGAVPFTLAYNAPPTDIGLDNSSVAENQPVGTTVGTFTTADQNAGDTHTYSLLTSGCSGTYADSASFQIGGTNGDELRTNAVFDYETKSTYAICVQTDDGNGGTYAEAFTITVTDATEPNSFLLWTR